LNGNKLQIQEYAAMDNLKNFRNDPLNLPDSDDEEVLQSSEYHQEVNTLKIEKLSNRVTIISIIIPCLICAILVFVYLDIKEQVVGVDATKKLQVEQIALQMEEKLNGLDLRVAKNKFDFEQQFPLLTKKEEALENQVAKMSASKADAKTIKADLSALEKKIKKNAGRNSSNLKAMKAANAKLLTSITKSNASFKEKAVQIQNEITLIKTQFDSRLVELSDYEEEIGRLRQTTIIIDKKLKGIDLEKLSQKELDRRFNQVSLTLEKMITDLDKKLTATKPTAVKKANISKEKQSSSHAKPVPQLDTEIKSQGISEETLTQ
jgi:chromosome segregation ATPase